MANTSIYLIEDDLTILRFLEESLKLRPDWELIGHSPSVADARMYAPLARADVYLVDLGLPDGHGEDVLRLLARTAPDSELLVFTVFGEETRLVQALEAGATGYVLKGCSGEELVTAIEQIRGGGAPISSLLARMLLKRFRPAEPEPIGLSAGKTAKTENNPLSDREMDVLKLVAQGYLNKEIADKLCISPHTVGTHVKSLYLKLSAHTKVQVVRAAQERGLV
jgi:DNA-binding NarL/FixJ family response regulator